MVNLAITAFLIDVVAAVISQIGLIVQKLAHRASERKQSSKRVNTPQQRRVDKLAAEDQDSQTQDLLVEEDESTASKAYCSW